jgi:hypothetical protein
MSIAAPPKSNGLLANSIYVYAAAPARAPAGAAAK